MKKKGFSNFEYEHERNQDLMHAYKVALSRQFHSGDDAIRLMDVFREIAEMPSQRFWVSEERAAIVVSDMMKGNKLKYTAKMKKEMFSEIYRRFIKLKRHKPHLTTLELVTEVCNQPAPKFYLTPKSIKVIIYKIKRKWYEKRKQRQHHLQ